MTSAEGEKHLRAALKALKINPWTLKFKPDYEFAALEYSDAANCFQSAGQYSKALQALRDFATTRQKQGDLFGAGRGFESVAQTCQNSLNDLEGSCEALVNAAECYALAGKIDSSCRIWLKIAEIHELRTKNIHEAACAYRKCLELYKIEEKDHNIADVLKNYVSFLARYLLNDKTYEAELLAILDQQMEVQARLNQNGSFGKTVLCKVVLRLLSDNNTAANTDLDQAVTIFPSFIHFKELHFAQELLASWDQGQLDEFQKLISSSTITYLPVEFAKLARQLKCPTVVAPQAPDIFPPRENTSSDEEEVPKSWAPEDVAEMLM